MKAVNYDGIKRRAYEIWERDGRPHGRDGEHWEQAEKELLDAAPGAQAKTRAKTGRAPATADKASLATVANAAVGKGRRPAAALRTQPH